VLPSRLAVCSSAARFGEVISHLGTLDFVVAKENVIFLGPPGTRKTHPGPAMVARSRAQAPTMRPSTTEFMASPSEWRIDAACTHRCTRSGPTPNLRGTCPRARATARAARTGGTTSPRLRDPVHRYVRLPPSVHCDPLQSLRP
jgi:hypothetical protein